MKENLVESFTEKKERNEMHKFSIVYGQYAIVSYILLDTTPVTRGCQKRLQIVQM